MKTHDGVRVASFLWNSWGFPGPKDESKAQHDRQGEDAIVAPPIHSPLGVISVPRWRKKPLALSTHDVFANPLR